MSLTYYSQHFALKLETEMGIFFSHENMHLIIINWIQWPHIALY